MNCRVAILLMGNAALLAGQESAVVSGKVIDSATRQPVAGAIVTIRSGDKVSSERSDEAGAFRLARLPAGEATAEVKRIGYRLRSLPLLIRKDTTVTISVVPTPASLARVDVLGKGEGVFGTIARSADLRVIPGARVLVVGSGVTATTDSVGQFFVPLKHPGSYMIRVTADGYGEEVLPLTVKKNEIAESSQLLDASDRKPLSTGLWDDFDQRLRWRPPVSALVSGAELRAAGGTMRDGLMASPSVIRKQLRLVPENVCLFVNGQPRPGMMIDDFRVEDIRAVELYQGKDTAYYVGMLSKMWPRKLPCGSGVSPGGSTRRPLGTKAPNETSVRFVVIWLR